jgi:hypothetical protein
MRRGDGVGMAVKKVESKGAGKGGAAKGSDQEKGLTRTVIPFEELVQKTIEEQFAEIVHCILCNVVELKHLGSAKFLIELANLVRSGKEVPATAYTAFAETLKEQFLLPANTGAEAGQNEQQSQGENTPVTDA